jgi:hypothetical protein
LKIPVYILTENGWSLVKNHLCELSSRRGQPINLDSVELIKGQQRTVIYNDAGHFTASKKDSLQPCTDCPYPCI